MKRLSLLLVLTLPLLLGTSVLTHAADSENGSNAMVKHYPKWFDYNPAPVNTNDEHGVPYGKNYFVKTPTKIYMSLMRRADLPGDRVILHLALNDAYTGCPKLSDLETKTSIEQNSISISVGDYRVDMRNLPQHTQECNTKQQFPSVDVLMNRDDLISNGINNMRLQMGKGIDIYDIQIDKEKMTLMASGSAGGVATSFKPQNIRNIVNPLIHWFYPDTTLILSIPNLDPKIKVADKIAEFAEKNGMIPLQEVYPDFQSPLVSTNQFYYVDMKGTLSAQVKPGRSESIGTVSVPKPIYGLIADETAEDDVSVFARHPDIYE